MKALYCWVVLSFLFAFAQEVGISLGNVAPDFSLVDLEGKHVKLSELRGKPVVLNFWASWCPPCTEEIPILQKANDALNQDEAKFHMVLVNLGENREVLNKFLTSNGIHLRVATDATGEEPLELRLTLEKADTVFRRYRAFGLPTTYAINPHGVIVAKQVGPFIADKDLALLLKTVSINWNFEQTQMPAPAIPAEASASEAVPEVIPELTPVQTQETMEEGSSPTLPTSPENSPSTPPAMTNTP